MLVCSTSEEGGKVSREVGMSNKGYHFVLVHGGCHGAWSWYKVVSLLRSMGHTATALDMASCGRDPKQVQDVLTIYDYFEPLMHFMEALPADEKVILVGHSKGGLDISMAMEKFPTKVAVAVFVTASMPSPTLDLSTLSEKLKPEFTMDTQFEYGNGKDKPPTSCLLGPEYMALKLYDLSPREDLTLATLSVRPCPIHSSDAFILTEQNYGSVGKVFVICEEDKVMGEEKVKWLINQNPPDEVKVIEGSDHMVLVSKPHHLCSCLQEIAAKYCS